MAPATVFAISLLVYARTLLPGVAFGDWGEMQTVPYILGVAHPTGYPTYILLAWLAQLVPLGSIAWRENMLAAVTVSVALAVACGIMRRLTIRPLIAIAAALALGAVGTVWAAATVAEVNALHLLFVALLLHRALVWEERRQTRDLVVGGLLSGLAVGNHLLTLFVIPFVALFVLWAGRREIAARPWILLSAAGATLVGLSVYLYIPLAASQSPALAYNHPTTLDSVLWLVEGTQFRDQFDFLSPSGPARFVASWPALWAVLIRGGTALMVGFGVMGLVALASRRRAFGLLCLAVLIANLYVWATYLRLEHYLLVTWLVLSIGAAYTFELSARLAAGRRAPLGTHRGLAVAIIALALATGLAVTNWQSADRSGDRSGEAYVDTVFSALPPDAAILTPWDASTPLWYARYVQGRRPDVLVVDDSDVVYGGWGTRELRIASLLCTRPVFILRARDIEVAPTRAAFRLEPFASVRIANGGPSAALVSLIARVRPADPSTCPS